MLGNCETTPRRQDNAVDPPAGPKPLRRGEGPTGQLASGIAGARLNAGQPGILLVEDQARIREGLGKIFRAAGYPCVTAPSAREALRHLAGRDFAVVVSDIVMPGMGGMELLAEIRARFRGTETVLISGFGTIDLAVEAMKMGARDFITKPFLPRKLVETVSHLVAGRLGPGPGDRFEVGDGGEIIGRSPSARRICEMVQRLRGNMANVLICGDTGSGKELVARAIHYGSARSGGPFIAVNCAGIPRTLAESHFFGHVRGAYTGAASGAKGFFRAADGGTLFLDEVTEVSQDFQAVLLRVIQDREVVPVGGTVPQSVDVRVIAATSKHGRRAVHAGLLREDLYYRLAVACVCVPPLRDRREDIPLLVDHFVALYAEQFGCPPKRVSKRAVDRLKTYDWPGNVRELSNVIERAYALGTGPTISAEDLAPSEMGGMLSDPGDRSSMSSRPGTRTFKETERQAIVEAMAAAGGQKKRAAELLGISRQTLYRKLRKHGLERLPAS